MVSSYKESLVQALTSLLADPKVFLLGEDIADPYGGAYGITKGLSTRFPGKVINTPMSEQGFTGIGVGMALAGFKPIVEIMFGDFSTLILDQVLNHASKFYEGFGAPMHFVARVPMGGYRGYGATHSQSLEKLFIGLPNISVVTPSVLHAPGPLLKYAMSLGNPVIFVENKLDYTRKLFGSDSISEDFEIRYHGDSLPVCEASFPDEDSDVTIISYGGLVHPLLHMMHDLYMEEEIATRLIDLSSLSEIDFNLLHRLVKDSARIITAEEGHIPGGVGDMIISSLVQKGLHCRYQSIGASLHIIGTSLEAESSVLPQMDDVRNLIING